jgi:hypothetical protein
MKIYLCGAQGTGKTTILNELRQFSLFKDFKFLTEVSRNLNLQHNIPINKESTNETQLLIYNKYLELFLLNDDFISDRSLIDVLSYTNYFYKTLDKIDRWVIEIQNEIFNNLKNKIDGIYFYFPIEFEVKKDKHRSDDSIYQAKIDNNILSYLSYYQIPYIEVKGTIKERTEIILANIK